MFRRCAACNSCSPRSPRDGHRRPALGEGLGEGSPAAAGSIRPRPRALPWKGGAPSAWPISIHSPSPSQRPAFVLLNKPAFFRGRMAPNLLDSCLSASQWLQGITWRSEWVPCGAQKRRKIHFCSSKQCLGSCGVVGEGPSPRLEESGPAGHCPPRSWGHTQLPPPAHLWLRVPGLSLKGDAYQRSEDPRKFPERLLPGLAA